jgi:hypothetical protein
LGWTYEMPDVWRKSTEDVTGMFVLTGSQDRGPYVASVGMQDLGETTLAACMIWNPSRSLHVWQQVFRRYVSSSAGKLDTLNSIDSMFQRTTDLHSTNTNTPRRQHRTLLGHRIIGGRIYATSPAYVIPIIPKRLHLCWLV